MEDVLAFRADCRQNDGKDGAYGTSDGSGVLLSLIRSLARRYIRGSICYISLMKVPKSLLDEVVACMTVIDT